LAEFDKLGYYTYLSGENKGCKSTDFLMKLKNFPKDIVMPKKPSSSFMWYVKKNCIKGKTAA
jgi:hypothetical protein